MPIEVLSISDTLLNYIYSPGIRKRFGDVDLVIGCGDLPYYYLEYIISTLNVPLFFVRGNHASLVEHSVAGPRTSPRGAVDLHRKAVCYRGLLLAGVEGSLRYSLGPFQYSQADMWLNVLGLVPRLLINRWVYGRYLDIFVSHSPPRGVHDKADLPHQGINAFLWLIKVFKPSYHFHGHIHVYRPDTETKTRYQNTIVINSYGYAETSIFPSPGKWAPLAWFNRYRKSEQNWLFRNGPTEGKGPAKDFNSKSKASSESGISE